MLKLRNHSTPDYASKISYYIDKDRSEQSIKVKGGMWNSLSLPLAKEIAGEAEWIGSIFARKMTRRLQKGS